jgi:hypothetical protein
MRLENGFNRTSSRVLWLENANLLWEGGVENSKRGAGAGRAPA